MKIFRSTTTKNPNIKRFVSVSPNALFNAFYLPYALHGDLVLSPDDIWLAITMSFSEYVNDHAEELRKIILDHEDEGMKEIIAVDTS